MSEFLHKTRMLAANTVVGLGVLTGCDVLDQTDMSHQKIGAESADAYQLPPEMANLPDGPCLEPQSTETQESRAKAQECLRAQQSGRIALLVLESSDLERAHEMADNTEKALADATAGIITPSVEPVLASDEAAKLITEAGTDCLDGTVEESPAFLADTVMPVLRHYDMILSASDMPACDPVAGLAFLDKSRHADLFGEHSSNTSTAGHEILHNYGLGHHGLFTADGNGRTLSQRIQDSPERFDLTPYLDIGDFYAYGPGNNIMGHTVDGTELLSDPSPLQIEKLNWPERELGLKERQAIPVDQNQTATLDCKEAADQAFALVQLEKPVELTDKNLDPKQTAMFDKLAIAPEYLLDPVDLECADMYGVTMYLANGHDSAKVSYINMSRESGVQDTKIILGGQAIKIAMHGNKLTVNSHAD